MPRFDYTRLGTLQLATKFLLPAILQNQPNSRQRNAPENDPSRRQDLAASPANRK